MSLFQNAADEELACLTLRALVEEFGAGNVIVLAPLHWQASGQLSLGRVTLQFFTENTIEIIVATRRTSEEDAIYLERVFQLA